MLGLGSYPTPVELLDQLSTARTALWIKRDDLTSAIYGGNKLRKLEYLLADAKSRGATRIITIGPVGSHHVLATGVFGKLAGFQVEAAVLRRPASVHALETLRATVAQGVTLFPAQSYTRAVERIAAQVANGAHAIPAGGTSRVGSLGVVDAVFELAAQIRHGALPEPELIVVPLGSGGTVAGLVAGLARAGLRSRVLAVTVTEPARLFERNARTLALELVDEPLRAGLLSRLELERSFLGAGYGLSNAASEHAGREAARVGIVLDATYSAKAFAAALARVAAGRERCILFWHTLSTASLEPLLRGAPLEAELDRELRELAY